MLCEVCYGKRFVAVNGRLLPCPECGAAGEVHCCEGMQEQPAPADENAWPGAACPPSQETTPQSSRP
jgi:hypothetical protein